MTDNLKHTSIPVNSVSTLLDRLLTLNSSFWYAGCYSYCLWKLTVILILLPLIHTQNKCWLWGAWIFLPWWTSIAFINVVCQKILKCMNLFFRINTVLLADKVLRHNSINIYWNLDFVLIWNSAILGWERCILISWFYC